MLLEYYGKMKDWLAATSSSLIAGILVLWASGSYALADLWKWPLVVGAGIVIGVLAMLLSRRHRTANERHLTVGKGIRSGSNVEVSAKTSKGADQVIVGNDITAEGDVSVKYQQP